MKDQPGFMPLWGQTNSKYGQAMSWMRLCGHYGGSMTTTFEVKKNSERISSFSFSSNNNENRNHFFSNHFSYALRNTKVYFTKIIQMK